MHCGVSGADVLPAMLSLPSGQRLLTKGQRGFERQETFLMVLLYMPGIVYRITKLGKRKLVGRGGV